MKRLKKFVLILAIFLSAGYLCACGEVRVSEDLASMSSQMVYNYVTNMQKQPKKYANKTYRIRGKISNTGDTMYMYGTYDSCCDWSIKLCTDNTDINLGNKSGKVTILGTYKKIGGEYVLDVIGLG